MLVSCFCRRARQARAIITQGRDQAFILRPTIVGVTSPVDRYRRREQRTLPYALAGSLELLPTVDGRRLPFFRIAHVFSKVLVLLRWVPMAHLSRCNCSSFLRTFSSFRSWGCTFDASPGASPNTVLSGDFVRMYDFGASASSPVDSHAMQ